MSGRRPRRGILVLTCLLVIGRSLTGANAHQHPCHRNHSCPSDHATYVCGDLGHYSECPDNADCVSGKPRPMAAQRVLPPPPLPPAEILTAPVLTIVDGATIDVPLEERTTRVYGLRAHR
jgi:hypothetical protein